ncbi:MAG: MFS transporter [Deltaproteobacteria bacterium]|nr:MFS transporter [Deltaproteobacteria bacterium]
MSAAVNLLAFLTGINLLNYMDRYVVAAVLEPMGRELSLSDAQLGWVQPVFIYAYMVAAPVFGALADRFHRPRLVAAGIALWSLATAAAAFAGGFAGILATRALVGVGEAAYASLGPAILSDCYPERERARSFTWFYLAIPVGSALGYAVGGVAAQAWGWRAAFLVAGIPGLILAWRMTRTADPPRGAMDTLEDRMAGSSFPARVRNLFSNRIWLACTMSYTAYTFAMGALSVWAPTLLQRAHGVSPGRAGIVFGGLAVVTGIAGTFAGGILTSRLQGRFRDAGVWISGLTLIGAAPVVAFAIAAPTPETAYAAFFIGMLLLFCNTSPVNTLAVSCVPASIRATGVAVNVFLIHLLGDALSPEWVGHRSARFIAEGAERGEALSKALWIAVPALAASGIVLLVLARGFGARGGPPEHSAHRSAGGSGSTPVPA